MQQNGETFVATIKMTNGECNGHSDPYGKAYTNGQANDQINGHLNNGEEVKKSLEILNKSDAYHLSGTFSFDVSKSDELGSMLAANERSHNFCPTLPEIPPSHRLKYLLHESMTEKAIRDAGRQDLLYLSPRALRLVSTDDPADDVYSRMVASQYHPETNPTGNINFCTACNDLCAELIRPKLEDAETFKAAIERMIRYPTLGGYDRTKQVVADYLSKWNEANVSPNELVIVPSGYASYDMLCHCLFEDDDIILAPSPTYSRTINNCADRAKVYIKPVLMKLPNFSLEIEPFEKAIEEYKSQGRRVCGINLINPHNPIGVIFTKQEVMRLCEWAAKNKIYVILDEVFSSCIHDPNTKFESFLSFKHELIHPEYIIYMWSPSKDFGMPGIKIAAIHSIIPALRKALARMTSINPVSTLAEDFAVKLFTDDQFLYTFRKSMVSRLRSHYDFVTYHLEKLNIQYVKATAAIFVLINLKKYLPTESFDGEIELLRKFMDVGIYITPGAHMAALEPGWFRLVWSCPKETLIEGFRRLYKFFGKDPSEIGTITYDH